MSAAAQDTSIISPAFITVGAEDISDGGNRTGILFAETVNKFPGGTAFKTVRRFVVNQSIASLGAATGRQDSFTVPCSDGDSVKVTLPSSWPANLLAVGPIIASGQVYMQLWNPTGGDISMSADDWVFEWTDYT